MSADHVARLADLLPASFAEDPFTGRFVELFDAVLDSVAARVDSAADYFDPNLAPPAFLRMLAAWAMLPRPAHAGDDELRHLVRNGLPLVRRRGTRAAVEELLRLALGCDVAVIDPTTVTCQVEPIPISPNRTRRSTSRASDDPVVVVRVRGWDHRWSAAEVADAVAREMPANCRYRLDLTELSEAERHGEGRIAGEVPAR